MKKKWFTTEFMGTAICECWPSYVREGLINGSGAIRVEHQDGTVDYFAGSRYDPQPLRWERRAADQVTELISSGLVLREFAAAVAVRDATREDLDRDAGQL